MSQVSQLDKVIRREEDEGTNRPPSQKMVMIDARDGTHLSKKSIFSFADPRYYLVSNANEPTHVAQGKIASVRLQDLEHNLIISATYEMRCRAGNEIRAAVALFDRSASPAVVLDRYLTRWLTELGQGGIPQLVQSYLQDRVGLASRVAGRAMADTGLEMSIRLFLDAEEALKPMVVTRDHLRVIVSDFQDEEQDLGFRITMEVDEPNRAAAILQFHRSSELEGLVIRELTKFIRQGVTMQVFYTDINAADVRQALAQHLDAKLAPYGRKIGACRLTVIKKAGLEFFQEDEHNVECKLHEYPTPIIILNKVQMILRDVARFKASKITDLKEWRQKNLERSVRQLLFGAQYIDVLIRFHKFEAEIRKNLNEEAAAIGYEIKQLITVPDLEPIKLKEPFILDTTGAFETRLANFHVKLQMVVTTRIPHLEDIESFLNRQQNVQKLMEEALLSVARQYLHGIDPQRFYMRFNFAEEGEQTVEDELTRAVEARLAEKFHAEVIEVVLKVVDTDIIERLRKFQERICPFEVQVDSLNGNETITFRGNFQVDGVDESGWHRFQLLTVGIDDVKVLLQEHILAKLQSMPPERIQFRNPNDHRELEWVLTKLAERFVCEQFGLAIRVTNVRRDRTTQESDATRLALGTRATALQLAESQMHDEATAAILINRSKVEQIEKLVAKRTLETDDTANEDYLAELDQKITQARSELVPVTIPTASDVEKALLPPSGQMSLNDFAKLVGLTDDGIPARTPPRIPEGDPK